jgi:hypothetical protein
MMYLTSRPDVPEDLEEGMSITLLTNPELELIGSLLYYTRLGLGVSPYRTAASTLMAKLDEYMDDEEFCSDSAANVAPMFAILDHRGNEIDALTADRIEIIV